jgi:hypothetical protein
MVFMVFICHGQPVLTNRVRTQWTDSREPSDPKSLADEGWTSLADATGADWAKWWKRQLSALESWKCHRWKQHLVVDAVFSLSWEQQFGCDMWTPYWNKPCSVLMCSTWYLNSWWLEHNMYELLGEKKQWQNGREMISWCSKKKLEIPWNPQCPFGQSVDTIARKWQSCTPAQQYLPDLLPSSSKVPHIFSKTGGMWYDLASNTSDFDGEKWERHDLNVSTVGAWKMQGRSWRKWGQNFQCPEAGALPQALGTFFMLRGRGGSEVPR